MGSALQEVARQKHHRGHVLVQRLPARISIGAALARHQRLAMREAYASRCTPQPHNPGSHHGVTPGLRACHPARPAAPAAVRRRCHLDPASPGRRLRGAVAAAGNGAPQRARGAAARPADGGSLHWRAQAGLRGQLEHQRHAVGYPANRTGGRWPACCCPLFSTGWPGRRGGTRRPVRPLAGAVPARGPSSATGGGGVPGHGADLFGVHGRHRSGAGFAHFLDLLRLRTGRAPVCDRRAA